MKRAYFTNVNMAFVFNKLNKHHTVHNIGPIIDGNSLAVDNKTKAIGPRAYLYQLPLYSFDVGPTFNLLLIFW